MATIADHMWMKGSWPRSGEWRFRYRRIIDEQTVWPLVRIKNGKKRKNRFTAGPSNRIHIRVIWLACWFYLAFSLRSHFVHSSGTNSHKKTTISPLSSLAVRCYDANTTRKVKQFRELCAVHRAQSQRTTLRTEPIIRMWVAVFNSVNGEHHRWMPLKNSIMWLNWEPQSKNRMNLFLMKLINNMERELYTAIHTHTHSRGIYIAGSRRLGERMSSNRTTYTHHQSTKQQILPSGW